MHFPFTKANLQHYPHFPQLRQAYIPATNSQPASQSANVHS
jgi:hypothetical protein